MTIWNFLFWFSFLYVFHTIWLFFCLFFLSMKKLDLNPQKVFASFQVENSRKIDQSILEPFSTENAEWNAKLRTVDNFKTKKNLDEILRLFLSWDLQKFSVWICKFVNRNNFRSYWTANARVGAKIPLKMWEMCVNGRRLRAHPSTFRNSIAQLLRTSPADWIAALRLKIWLESRSNIPSTTKQTRYFLFSKLCIFFFS